PALCSARLRHSSPTLLPYTTLFRSQDAVKVRYTGILPDLFREGQGVVAEGSFGPDGVFVADSVLAKHDENYMPREVAEGLKEKGDRKSTRLNSSHVKISYAVICLKK